MSETGVSRSQPAPGRECGACALCCKVLTIAALHKPRNVWCGNCKPGKGCGIHSTRPDECRDFFCVWMADGGFGPEWRPDRAKFMMAIEQTGSQIIIHCDPSAPGAWRNEPYYSTINAWARMQGTRREVLVKTGKKMVFVAPAGEFEIAEPGEGEQIVLTYNERQQLVGAKVASEPAGAR